MMLKKLFSRKSRIICFLWGVVAVIFVCLIWIAAAREDRVLQGMITNIVPWYIFVSFILCGIVAYLSRKERKAMDD